MTASQKTCAVVLAAGYASRMGAFKPLLNIGGKPALRYLTDHIMEAGIEDIFIVTGYQADALRAAVDGPALSFVHNPDYDKGMFRSIQVGIRAAVRDGRFASILLFPVDVPLVPAAVIKRLVAESAARGPEDFAVPCYMGKKGHPLRIPLRYAQEILNDNGAGGLKGITNRYFERFYYMETGQEAVLLDMDTPAGYEEILTYLAAPPDEKACPAFHGRLLLVRHGSTELHRDKIFLGQADVPLSDVGRREARAAVEQLRELDVAMRRIYSSDLCRARETAELIVGGCPPPVPEIVISPGFREMALGDWDGRYIAEIKEAFPEEYERRGRNILRYKRGGGENFYDLRYRVVKTLKKVLKAEGEAGATDIVIVSHSGVIKAITSYLTGRPAEEVWSMKPPRGAVLVVDV